MSRCAARGGIGKRGQSDSSSAPWGRALYDQARAPSLEAIQDHRKSSVPGERLNEAVIDYLCRGKAASVAIPDATDPSLDCFRVSDAS
ncbi:hypothetical protein AB431_12260 [Mycobacterium sp. EPa45]|nr:hypothetical protein AB431_12260 [Mycobacterium sp. EPa45]